MVVEERQASPVMEEEQFLQQNDHQTDSSPSYSGWSSDDDKDKMNL
jgi:hypothetical protein